MHPSLTADCGRQSVSTLKAALEAITVTSSTSCRTYRTTERPRQVAGCIFYADLRLKQSPDYSNPNGLVLKLNRGRSVDDSESARFYELIIDWKGWTPQLRESFGKELEARRSESMCNVIFKNRARRFERGTI